MPGPSYPRDSDPGRPVPGGGSDRGGSDRGGSDRGGSDRGGSDRGGSDRGGSDRGGAERDGGHRRHTPAGSRPASWWTSRTQALLAAAVVVVVISIGGWVLAASRPAGTSRGGPPGSLSHRSALAGSPGVRPSGSAASATPQSDATVSIDWVGDMTFGTLDAWPAAGAGSLLADVRGDLRSDLTLGNLETALGDLAMSKCAPGEADCYQFEAPRDTAADLKRAGFSAVNVANNHTLDAGTAGEASTEGALRAAGLAWAGRPGQIAYLTRNGVTVALLGFAPWSYDANALDIHAAQTLVRQARQHAQVVIVMQHIGAEGAGAQHVRPGEEYFLGQDRGNPIAFTHAVIDAGADLVVGSGPHVLRGFQWYRGHLIAYSLGNFCGYNTLGLNGVTSISAVLHVKLGAQGQFVSGSVTPLRLVSPGVPEPDPEDTAIATINALSGADFGGNGAATISAAGTIERPAA